MTKEEFDRKRQQGWNPVSPEDIPVINHIDDAPEILSSKKVVGYLWSEKEFDEIEEIAQTLDKPGDKNQWGGNGSSPAEYGEGYIYTHRDIIEARDLLTYMERGNLYKVEGYAFERINSGLVSGGSLDQIERLFPVEEIVSWHVMDADEIESEPTLFDRFVAK
jgi:hypothetical protein